MMAKSFMEHLRMVLLTDCYFFRELIQGLFFFRMKFLFLLVNYIISCKFLQSFFQILRKICMESEKMCHDVQKIKENTTFYQWRNQEGGATGAFALGAAIWGALNRKKIYARYFGVVFATKKENVAKKNSKIFDFGGANFQFCPGRRRPQLRL